jgi:hypothetical protein
VTSEGVLVKLTLKLLNIATLLYMTTAVAQSAAPTEIPLEIKKVVNGVEVASGKKNSIRLYQGRREQELNVSLDQLYSIVSDFSSRCNNELKDKRQHLDKSFQCKHLNKNMIETVVIRDIPKIGDKEPNEVDRFVMARYVYNRGYFYHYELTKVYKYKNDQGRDTIRIMHKMMQNDEAKQYVSNAKNKETAFLETRGEFILTGLDKNKSHLQYIYQSQTDHWVLNKEMVVAEFFENMSYGVNELFTAINSDTLAMNTIK